MINSSHIIIRLILAAILLLPISSVIDVNGQSPDYKWYYRVYFTDKGENTINLYLPEDLLSDKAIARREKSSIQYPDIRDIPVSASYISQLKQLGLTLHCVSRWMNSALLKSVTEINPDLISALAFVKEVKLVKRPAKNSQYNNKLDFQVTSTDIPPFDRPLTMLNGITMHLSGYNGKGVLIAVLDGGFQYADQINSLNNLRNRDGIKAVHDFVTRSGNVYSSSTHGTAVLSVLAGDLPDLIRGTATGADYILLKTEDVGSEFPYEEDMWVAGAEFADSAGADIISSSLGYYNFDDFAMNYKPEQLDGNTAFISVAADIAASKGILVVNSAGNERAKDWKRIIFPADGNSVLAAGAVDGNNAISTFSSAGPSYDRRVKPDLSALGVSVPVQVSASSTGRSNGTSFSCPVLSGMAACLMQAVPEANNTETLVAMQRSGDRYHTPDSLYGFGVPDIVKALSELQDLHIITPENDIIAAPNPTGGDLELIFREPPGSFNLEIITLSGKTLFSKEYPEWAGRSIRLTALQESEQGVYYIRIIKSTGNKVLRIIKLKN